MRLLALFVCLFITAQSLYSQAYQRIFRHGDRDNTTLDAFHTDNRNTYVLSIFQDTIAGLQGINLTRHDEKGSNRWSRDYYVADTISMEPFGEILSLPDEQSIIMTVRTKDNGAYGQLVLHTDGMGVLNYSGALGGVQMDTTEVNRVELFESPYGGYLTATQDSIDSLSSVLVNYMGVDGSMIWNQSYSAEDTLGNTFQHSFSDMVVEPDSNILIVGSFRDTLGSGASNVINDGFYLARFDTLGVPVWSQEYTVASSTEIVPLDMEILADSSIMIVGARVLTAFQGFACRISKEGELIWRKNIQATNIPEAFQNIHINEVTQGANGNVVVSGIVSKLNPFVQGVVNIELTIEDGSLVWSKVYDRETVFNTIENYLGSIGGTEYTPLKYNNQGNLFSSADNGFMVVNGMYDGPGFQTPQASPLLIKTDDIGGAICENEFEVFFDTLVVNVDTLVWTVGEGAFLQNLEVLDVQYFGISAPVLGIEEVVVCPNLPIDTFLDATQTNAIMYEWATGDTTAILNVMEEGDYPVTVTFDSEVCFTLCDTAKVSLYDELTSEIDNVNWELWCTDRIFRLDGQGIDGQEPYNYAWNTGDSTQVILMPEDSIEMTFTVTVTDECGMTSETSIYIGYDHDGIPEPDMVTISFNEVLYCSSPEDNRAYILELSVDEPGFDQSTIQWSTGAADDGQLSISVDGPGMYSVTLVDNCQYEITDDIDFDVPGPETIELEVLEDVCYEQIILNVESSGNIDINTIQWSTGPMDNGQTVIDVEDYSVPYSVTVVDDCNYTLTDEITVDPNLEPTPAEVILSQSESTCGAIITINVDVNEIDPSTIVWTPDLGCNGSLECTYDGTLPGTVFVNLTDQCGFNITESIDVNPDFMAEPAPISYKIEQDPCGFGGSLGMEGAYIILTGPEGYDQSTITWSTDATAAGSDSLYVTSSDPNIITVTLNDQCGLTTSETIEINIDDYNPGVINLVVDTMGYCMDGTINLTTSVGGSANVSTITWFFQDTIVSGLDNIYITKDTIAENQDEIDTLMLVENISFLVSVVDECNISAFDSLTIDEIQSFPTCGNCLKWPNIFFPSRQNSVDGDTTDFFFQPVALNCDTENVVGYELYVYNGYGNLVFESTDIEQGWNGRKDDDEQPSGVYMYYARWTFNNVEYESKGDVSLMR